MSTMQIGEQLAALCRQGKNMEAIETLYSPEIVSVEACSMPGMEQTQTGLEAIKAKNQWWFENHEVHGGEVKGPFQHEDRFALLFHSEITPKQTGQRMSIEEIGVYTVKDGKIVKEEFFYTMPG